MPIDNHISFLSDDSPDDENNERIHLLAADDYYLTVAPGTQWPGGAPCFRACCSGARDDGVTFLLAALFKYGQGDGAGAARAAHAFVKHVRSQLSVDGVHLQAGDYHELYRGSDSGPFGFYTVDTDAEGRPIVHPWADGDRWTRTAAEWDQQHSTGVAVRYWPIAEDDASIDTVTRGGAFEIGPEDRRDPLVRLVGVRGGVSLSHLQVIGPTSADLPEEGQQAE